MKEIYEKIRRFFQPYYRIKPKELIEFEKAQKNVTKEDIRKRKTLRIAPVWTQSNEGTTHISSTDETVQQQNTEASETVNSTETVSVPTHSERPASDVGKSRHIVDMSDDDLKMRIIQLDVPIDKILRSPKKPKADTIWYYHDKGRHQVFAHLPKSGWNRYLGRDDKARMSVTPMIYPKKVGVWDRAHLIPKGYHNSESDVRLLVGWDSGQNQKQMAEFERRQSARNEHEAIYWYTDVRRTDNGAVWIYITFSVQTGEVLDQLRLDMKDTSFHWAY